MCGGEGGVWISNCMKQISNGNLFRLLPNKALRVKFMNPVLLLQSPNRKKSRVFTSNIYLAHSCDPAVQGNIAYALLSWNHVQVRTIENGFELNLLFHFHVATGPSEQRPPHHRGFTITLRHIQLCGTPLDE